MTTKLDTINLALPLRTGRVNCYLLPTDTGHILFDTGGANQRTELLRALGSAGCRPGRLRLIILTHGDFDHSGNAAFLRQEFGAKIAMHRDDAGMVEHGNMFWNRQPPNWLIQRVSGLVFKLKCSDRFVPDIYLEDGEELTSHGLEAEVIHLPGHSLGSIGILLRQSHELIGGDLLDNVKMPGLNALMDDLSAAKTSVARLPKLEIDMVYPGHGAPFFWDAFLATYQA